MGAVRKAEADLDAAQWALDDLEQKLAEQKQLVSDAASLLTGKEDVVDSLRIALNTVKKGEDQFNEQIGQAKELVSNLREELSNMKKASEAILEIKKYVSATALKMGYFVDIAVREPVREIGLVEETKVWDYFSENVPLRCVRESLNTNLPISMITAQEPQWLYLKRSK